MLSHLIVNFESVRAFCHKEVTEGGIDRAPAIIQLTSITAQMLTLPAPRIKVHYRSASVEFA